MSSCCDRLVTWAIIIEPHRNNYLIGVHNATYIAITFKYIYNTTLVWSGKFTTHEKCKLEATQPHRAVCTETIRFSQIYSAALSCIDNYCGPMDVACDIGPCLIVDLPKLIKSPSSVRCMLSPSVWPEIYIHSLYMWYGWQSSKMWWISYIQSTVHGVICSICCAPWEGYAVTHLCNLNLKYHAKMKQMIFSSSFLKPLGLCGLDWVINLPKLWPGQSNIVYYWAYFF